MARRNKLNADEKLAVKIISPTKLYFDGSANAFTAINETGEFDVLPHHHNFISLLIPCTAKIVTPSGSVQEIEISGGIMQVKDNSVTVFLDI